MILSVDQTNHNARDEQSPLFHFHVTRASRDKYRFDEDLFSIRGRVVFANFNGARRFAQKINATRPPGQGVSAAEIQAMGLIDEIFHFVIENYRKQVNPSVLNDILDRLAGEYGAKNRDALLTRFVDIFPPPEVYKREITAAQYIKGQSGELSNREIVMEEMLVQWLNNRNPAYKNIKELINDSELKLTDIYEQALGGLSAYLRKQARVPGSDLSLIDFLLSPSLSHPESVYEQLEFIRSRWRDLAGGFLSLILMSMDLFREEAKRFDPGTFHEPETNVPGFGPEYEFEPEQFSPDLDWMPHLVLIAKSTYVWLDQLSKKYGLEINRLDQIPDEELNRLANFGITGLWLIGVWERSNASRKIKQINGNPEAVASAYSLYDYVIANDLGGEQAYYNLRDRAWRRGIRLASDMVPNHTGLDSRWIKQHPDWFVQSEHPPFPGYSFHGVDLSNDPDLSIHIEDGYWDKTDAAVVFKIWDHRDKRARYIYHGNDGTGMPWNDTAQLNYLNPQVREAVVQTILHVARQFPIIRFDAAMTLAKRHFQRLWFPEPGSGGDIPSRAEHGLTKDQFNELFPVEFWREVVDRVQQEVPDTLLLAEAFWMMEGYFVRSLGMHRVYNSAFMNMLKKEENAKYREMIRNVLEFNPQILKRYVNFMNNPDEETAVAQFGKGDKYFGICILMCTMPGLPMFGHGQIEGYSEKYGMEYRRAYWDEKDDEYLVNRHKLEVFPLLKKRRLFSEVDHFLFYDFETMHGTVDENVFCYSNIYHDERSLVLYNNKYNDTAGWVRTSVGYNDGSDNLQRTSLADGLGLSHDPNQYVILHDHISQTEVLRRSTDIIESGFYAQLGAFKYMVFTPIRIVYHNQEHPYHELYSRLQGRAVASVDDAMEELKLAPLITAMENLIGHILNTKWHNRREAFKREDIVQPLRFINAVWNFAEWESEKTKLETVLFKRWTRIHKNSTAIQKMARKTEEEKHFVEKWSTEIELKTLAVVATLQIVLSYHSRANAEKSWNNWFMNKIIKRTMDDLDALARKNVAISVKYENLFDIIEEEPSVDKLGEFFNLSDVKEILAYNVYQGQEYINKERWEHFLDWQAFVYIMMHSKGGLVTFNRSAIAGLGKTKKLAGENGYDLGKIKKALLPEKKSNKKEVKK